MALATLLSPACHKGSAEGTTVPNVTVTASSQAETIVRDVARLADQRDFDGVKARFASHVVLDYGYPDLVSPSDIVAAWRPLLSNFDRTEHALSDVVVTSKDDRTLATARFHAVHTLAGIPGGDTYTLDGHYEYELTQEDGALRISRIRMIAEGESGNHAVLDEARRRGGVVDAVRGHTVEHVEFTSGGDVLRGLLYRPNKPIPGEIVVTTGSWTTVKEMMPRLYAKRMADHGYTTLVFDFRGFGESDGRPRFFESPTRKTEDYIAAVGFASSQAGVDKVTILGVCASSGYAAGAAARLPQVTRLALVAPWLHDPELARQNYTSRPGIEPNGYDGLLQEGSAAADTFRRTGVSSNVASASSTDAHAAMYVPHPSPPGDYYFNRDRGLVPQWGNQFARMSWPEWLQYDAVASAPNIHMPTILIHSEQGALPRGAHRFIDRLTNQPEVHWISGGQLDFYDQPAKIDEALGYVLAFLASHP